jgi:hypothetical protein
MHAYCRTTLGLRATTPAQIVGRDIGRSALAAEVAARDLFDKQCSANSGVLAATPDFDDRPAECVAQRSDSDSARRQ